MNHEADELLATRHSLLTRLRDAGDRSGWQEFFDTYWKLLYRVALKSGLTDAEAQDAVQETIITVAQQMPQFRYEPARCSFKGWLLLLTRQRIAHQFRKRKPAGGHAPALPTGAGEGVSADTAPPTVDQLPDTGGAGFETLWDAEWRAHVFTAALEEVKRKTTDRQFQIFDLHVLQQCPVAEVSRVLRVSAAQVYLAKHRVGRLLQRAARRLEKELR